MKGLAESFCDANVICNIIISDKTKLPFLANESKLIFP